MSKFITDTMAYILYLEKRKMPDTTRFIFKNAESGENDIVVPSIVTESGLTCHQPDLSLSFSACKVFVPFVQVFSVVIEFLSIAYNLIESSK
jgi:hypothetical protein